MFNLGADRLVCAKRPGQIVPPGSVCPERSVEPSAGLFHYQAQGFRTDVASFGGMTYVTYDMLRFGRVADDREAVEVGMRACRQLMELQGPHGQWPWIINVGRGTGADWYQVYSVHQDSMAALFLTEALAAGCHEARDAIVNGFQWVFGENELNRNMVSLRHGMVERSLVRKGRFKKSASIGKDAAPGDVNVGHRVAPRHLKNSSFADRNSGRKAVVHFVVGRPTRTNSNFESGQFDV